MKVKIIAAKSERQYHFTEHIIINYMKNFDFCQ